MWEWKEEAPTTEDVMDALRTLTPVWGVQTIDYADFVLPMERNEKVKVGKETRYVPTWRLYMQVAGRVKMAEEACQVHGFGLYEEIELTESMVIVRNELWRIDGDDSMKIRSTHGLASVAGGDAPWMKAETAARGRALGGLGFGVLPGTGIASLDEMQIVETYGVDLRPETKSVRDRSKEEVIEAVVEAKEELRQLRGQEVEELDDKLGAYVLSAFGADIRTDEGLAWTKLNKGKLLLVHSSLTQQIAQAKTKESEE